MNAQDSSAISRIIAKWKDQLEAQYLTIHQTSSAYGRAYICSPCTARNAAAARRNMLAARFYMWFAHENCHVVARAPHAYLPILLNDHLPAERALALRFGLELVEQSERMLVCGKRLSPGMKGEIARAYELGIPITVYDEELHKMVCAFIRSRGGNSGRVLYCGDFPFLACSAEELLGEGGQDAVQL